jgi:uncharacterized membrane protein YkoI
MKKRLIALFLLVALALSVMAGCGSSKSDVVTQEQAQQIAIEEIGISQNQVTDAHIHVTMQDGIPCYSVHLTTAAGEYSVLIHAGTGEVLNTGSGANH